MISVIEFGSRIQGSIDSFSDKDALVIHSEKTPIIKTIMELKSNSYSTSILNTSKAHYLASTGSLFLKHIINEGREKTEYKVINELRKKWQPAKNYNKEIESNLELLSSLENTPRNLYGLLAAIDITTSSIRNIIIRKLAIKGIYEFSWTAILKNSVKLGMITHRDSAYILMGRKIKNTYRRKLYLKPNTDILESLNEILHKIDTGRKITFSTHRKIINQPENFENGSYAQLRAIELLCAEYSFDSTLERLSKLTSQPNYFCSTSISEKI